MKRSIIIACMALAAAGAFASGEWDYGTARINGSGRVRVQDRAVAAFTAIELEGPGTVIVSQGIARAVSVETDDNVLSVVKTEVVGGVLHLGFRAGTSVGRLTRLEYRVTAPLVEGIVISGSGDVRTATELRAGSLSLEIRGSGDIEADVITDDLHAAIGGSGGISVSGRTGTLDASIDGSGDIRARGLASQAAEVRINGSGSADVTAAVTVGIVISGSGDVTYGGGARASVRASGSGTARER